MPWRRSWIRWISDPEASRSNEAKAVGAEGTVRVLPRLLQGAFARCPLPRRSAITAQYSDILNREEAEKRHHTPPGEYDASFLFTGGSVCRVMRGTPMGPGAAPNHRACCGGPGARSPSMMRQGVSPSKPSVACHEARRGFPARLRHAVVRRASHYSAALLLLPRFASSSVMC